MIAFIAGMFTGASCGFLLAGLLRAADEPDTPQLPTLGRGTWLVCIDGQGEMTRCEPHVCFEAAFNRLEEAMRKDDL